MLDVNEKILYVGKAKNIKKRVSQYFQKKTKDTSTIKTDVLMQKVAKINTTVTNNETEALLLEQSLIKQLSPPYNIVFRDDKSYPYIYLSGHSDFPLLGLRRVAKGRVTKTKDKGQYFGPYPSAGAVRESLNILQKTFLLRQCEDSFFKNRSRPCLQYQIKRCSAPCVNLITEEHYKNNTRRAIMFLQGKNEAVINELIDAMESASEKLDFENAANYRDQISQLRTIQRSQSIVTNEKNTDTIVCLVKAGVICIEVLYVRKGLIIGNKTYFPKSKIELSNTEILSAFLPQLYVQWRDPNDIPENIVISEQLVDITAIKNVLENTCGHKVNIIFKPRGNKLQWLQLAHKNAGKNLDHHLQSKTTLHERFFDLQESLKLASMPQRIECFDVSHHSGEATIASCVVFNRDGPLKSDYRRYNIDNIAPRDDYAALEQALKKRYLKLKSNEGKLPDIILIDGGKGQLNILNNVMEELQVSGITLIGIAKGKSRKPGLETCFIAQQEKPIDLSPDSKALHLLQHIRDEAHRFAITGHRQKTTKTRKKSFLENVEGIGPKKRRALLHHFGGLDGLRQASQSEIANVSGINAKLAKSIYNHIHNGTIA